jgi:nitroimidazol reductase NimA-like FMN-containing flavoprotein (pyridoxamine 5'-phosphate oxidase superfamily)
MIGELDKNQIEDFLKSELIGRIGCYDSGKIFVVPVTYAYNDGYIYGHTNDGLKIHMMRNNPNVCFEIDWMKSLNNWKSVIAYGTFEELKGKDAKDGLEILLNTIKSILNKKNFPKDPRLHNNNNNNDTDIENFAFDHSFLSSFVHRHGNESYEPIVYRIKLSVFTGKFENE